MNRKATPILLAIAMAIGLITYVSERASRPSGAADKPQTPRVLNVGQADILQVRVKRDFWNSYTLARDPDGTWQITEPSREPAFTPAVNNLLATIEKLPVIATIDLPSDDSERHREYGLWEPSLELTVKTGESERTLLFGTTTSDGAGTYVVETGRDGVFVTTKEAVQVLSTEYASYRQGAATSEPPAPAGWKVEDLAVGTGAPARAGQTVSVHYTGRLTDGQLFDSSLVRGQPFSLTIGAGQVIRGWDLGLVGMRQGGKRRLTIPPELAYGAPGKPPTIPPNATLTFDIDLLSIADK